MECLSSPTGLSFDLSSFSSKNKCPQTEEFQCFHMNLDAVQHRYLSLVSMGLNVFSTTDN